MRHDELRDLVAVHALDALDGPELSVVRAHLASCPPCRADLGELREVAAMLIAPEPPPPDSWNRLLASLDDPARPTRAPPVLPHMSSRGSLRTAKRAFAAVSLTCLAAAGAAAWWWDHDRLTDRIAAASAGDPLAAAAAAAVADGDATLVALRDADGADVAAAVVERDGDGFVVRNDLPPLPASLTYQLWATSGDRVVSLGVLGPDPGLAAFHFQGPVDEIAITVERTPGAAAQTQPLAAVGVVNR